MQIKPKLANFENWIACVPDDADLIFLSTEKFDLLMDYPFKALTRDQVMAQGQLIWTLNFRSWYGYALNYADHCVCLPKGAIESFGQKLRTELADEQRKLKVPTLIENRWITSYAWSHLSNAEKINTLQLWFVQNEVQIHQSFDLPDLPEDVKTELTRIDCDQLLNRFSNFSGPNCFAATAGALAKDKDICSQWMHWPEFEKHLSTQATS